MVVSEWLQSAQQRLQDAEVATARLDALVLLEDCLDISRAQLLAHPETKLTTEQLTILNGQLQQRSSHEPLAYIRHRSEFYGRDFYVDRRVLEPRPESETIITLLKQLAVGTEPIIDIGTGSGALAITAQLELPRAQVTAIDIDENCLMVARKNAVTHQAKISCLQGNLVEPLLQSNRKITDTILLCNLPYVPDDFHINQAASHEPRLAIFGGADGLDLYRSMFTQLDSTSTKPKLILAESLPLQHAALTEIALGSGYRQQLEDDFIQAFVPAA